MPHIINFHCLIASAKTANLLPPEDAGRSGRTSSAFCRLRADWIAFLRPEWQPCFLDRSGMEIPITRIGGAESHSRQVLIWCRKRNDLFGNDWQDTIGASLVRGDASGQDKDTDQRCCNSKFHEVTLVLCVVSRGIIIRRVRGIIARFFQNMHHLIWRQR